MATSMLRDSSPGEWREPPARPRLAEGDVHVWRLRVDEATADSARSEGLLSADEHERTTRYIADHARRAFLVTRTGLRLLLARYLRVDPKDLCFEYSSQGKPYLQTDHEQLPRFSVSHSGDLALLAIACGREVGIDIEQVRDGVMVDDLAQRFFTQHEVATLQQLSPLARQRAFFSYWTRKEAVVKATGDGMKRALNTFEVTENSTTIDHSLWRVDNVTVGGDYAAAVCALGSTWRPIFYDQPSLTYL